MKALKNLHGLLQSSHSYPGPCRHPCQHEADGHPEERFGEDGLREVVQGYVDAWERGDVDALAARLAEDAVFAMPPEPTWFRGQGAIAAFLRATPMREDYRWRVIPTSANGQPAFAHYIWVEKQNAFVPEGVAVLTLDGDKIAELTVFRDPELFERFGLPARL